MSEKDFKILGLAASLRRASFHRGILRAAHEVCPEGMACDSFDLGRIPFFNADVEAEEQMNKVMCGSASYLPALEGAGYVLRVREPDFDEHRMFRTPAKDVHVHVFSAGSREIERYLLLREDEGDRDLYARTKRELARREWPSVDHYAEAKTEVIEGIIARAAARSARAGSSGEQHQ